MTVTAISVNAVSGNVGQTYTVSPAGQPVGTDPRFYFDTVPAGSALLALASFIAPPQDITQWRMKSVAAGGSFTPDVPGIYVIRLRDVTVVRPQPHYLGQVVAGPSDNEVQSPNYGGGAAAPEVITTFYVAQTIERTIGFGPDKATLDIRVISNSPDNGNPAVIPVTLINGATSAAKMAINDTILQEVLTALRSEIDLNTYLHVLGSAFSILTNNWIGHVNLTNGTVHAVSDTANSLVSTTCSNLSTAIALLSDLQTKYNAHRVLSAVHGGFPDAINAMTGSPGATLATATFFCQAAKYTFEQHATSNLFHGLSLGDGAAGEWIEAPVTLVDLVRVTNQLAALYEGHRVKTAYTAHAASDATNFVGNITPTTLPQLYELLNRQAAAMNNHAQNLKNDNTAPVTPFHQNKGARLVLNQASDPRSAALTFEECWLAIERHSLDGGTTNNVHASKALGVNYSRYLDGPGGVGGNPTRWPWMARIQKAYRAALDVLAPNLPPGVNSAAANAVLTYGWTAK